MEFWATGWPHDAHFWLTPAVGFTDSTPMTRPFHAQSFHYQCSCLLFGDWRLHQISFGFNWHRSKIAWCICEIVLSLSSIRLTLTTALTLTTNHRVCNRQEAIASMQRRASYVKYWNLPSRRVRRIATPWPTCDKRDNHVASLRDHRRDV